MDGYLANCDVGIDADGDWVVSGGLSRVEPLLRTDINGRYSLTSEALGFVMVLPGSSSCVDQSTGLSLRVPFRAPNRATVVSPLTTLLSAVMEGSSLSQAKAEEKVIAALGLPSSLSLATFDPYKAATAASTPAASQQAVLVAALLSQWAAVLRLPVRAVVTGAALEVMLHSLALGEASRLNLADADDVRSIMDPFCEGLANLNTIVVEGAWGVGSTRTTQEALLNVVKTDIYGLTTIAEAAYMLARGGPGNSSSLASFAALSSESVIWRAVGMQGMVPPPPSPPPLPTPPPSPPPAAAPSPPSGTKWTDVIPIWVIILLILGVLATVLLVFLLSMCCRRWRERRAASAVAMGKPKVTSPYARLSLRSSISRIEDENEDEGRSFLAASASEMMGLKTHQRGADPLALGSGVARDTPTSAGTQSEMGSGVVSPSGGYGTLQVLSATPAVTPAKEQPLVKPDILAIGVGGPALHPIFSKLAAVVAPRGSSPRSTGPFSPAGARSGLPFMSPRSGRPGKDRFASPHATDNRQNPAYDSIGVEAVKNPLYGTPKSAEPSPTALGPMAMASGAVVMDPHGYSAPGPVSTRGGSGDGPSERPLSARFQVIRDKDGFKLDDLQQAGGYRPATGEVKSPPWMHGTRYDLRRAASPPNGAPPAGSSVEHLMQAVTGGEGVVSPGGQQPSEGLYGVGAVGGAGGAQGGGPGRSPWSPPTIHSRNVDAFSPRGSGPEVGGLNGPQALSAINGGGYRARAGAGLSIELGSGSFPRFPEIMSPDASQARRQSRADSDMGDGGAMSPALSDSYYTGSEGEREEEGDEEFYSDEGGNGGPGSTASSRRSRQRRSSNASRGYGRQGSRRRSATGEITPGGAEAPASLPRWGAGGEDREAAERWADSGAAGSGQPGGSGQEEQLYGYGYAQGGAPASQPHAWVAGLQAFSAAGIAPLNFGRDRVHRVQPSAHMDEVSSMSMPQQQWELQPPEVAGHGVGGANAGGSTQPPSAHAGNLSARGVRSLQPLQVDFGDIIEHQMADLVAPVNLGRDVLSPTSQSRMPGYLMSPTSPPAVKPF
eukprot:jgi/Mesvir1/16911/Mv15777-RA.1